MAIALDVAVVCEMVLSAEFRRDKAESLVVVEPFHNTKFCFQYKS